MALEALQRGLQGSQPQHCLVVRPQLDLRIQATGRDHLVHCCGVEWHLTRASQLEVASQLVQGQGPLSLKSSGPFQAVSLAVLALAHSSLVELEVLPVGPPGPAQKAPLVRAFERALVALLVRSDQALLMLVSTPLGPPGRRPLVQLLTPPILPAPETAETAAVLAVSIAMESSVKLVVFSRHVLHAFA